MKNIVAPSAFTTTAFTPSHYRPEIDGLRALAVLLVVSYHYFAVRGGFVGVDVFFVISGYLISHQIFTDLDRGSFSLLEFYAKRIRRIFPPLLLVIVTFLVVGWLLLLPGDFRSLGKHAAAGIAYVSNILLWTESGYFDAPSSYKPFLHLWSLGIEEQFYFTWPLAMILLYRFINRKLAVLLGLTGISFMLSVIATRFNQDMAFYMPVTRFWELAAGGVLAYCSIKHPNFLQKRFGSEISANVSRYACALGLFLLVLVVLLVDQHSAYPGYWALLPVCAACLILVKQPQSDYKKKILTQPALLLIGKVSYGIYLWHWPLLVIAHLSDQTSGTAKLIALGATFVLAYGTYRFVEIPVRSIRMSRTCAIKFIYFGVLTTLCVSVFGLLVSTGRIHRDWDKTLITAQYTEPVVGCAADARPDRTIDYSALQTCEKITYPNRPTVMLLGDSHAFGLYQGLAPELDAQKINLIGFPAMYCTPLSLLDQRPTCAQYNQWLQSQIMRIHPEIVIVFAHHVLWSDDEHYGEQSAYDTYLWKAAEQLKKLGAGKVLIVGQVPTWINSLPHNINLNFLRKGLPVPQRTYVGIDPASLKMDETMRAHSIPGVDYISLRDGLCLKEGCLTAVGDQYPNDLIVHDYGHLTKNGARYIAQTLLSQKILSLLP